MPGGIGGGGEGEKDADRLSAIRPIGRMELVAATTLAVDREEDRGASPDQGALPSNSASVQTEIGAVGIIHLDDGLAGAFGVGDDLISEVVVGIDRGGLDDRRRSGGHGRVDVV